MRHDKESLGGEGQKSRIAASREDWDFRWRLGANPPPSPNKHSLFVFLPTPRRSLFVSPPDGCRSSISLHSDNLRNSSCPHFRPPSPEAGWRRERGPGGAEAVDAARAEPTSAAFSRERPSGRGGGTARSEPPGREAPGAPGAHPHRGGCGAEATLGEVEARGARGRVGRTGRSSAADLTGAPARPIR